MGKRIAILIFILCLAMALILFIVVRAKTKEPKRMVIVERLGSYHIVYDKYTKVMYSVSSGGYNRGTLTLLVDADGKPLLYTEKGESK